MLESIRELNVKVLVLELKVKRITLVVRRWTNLAFIICILSLCKFSLAREGRDWLLRLFLFISQNYENTENQESNINLENLE